MCAKNLYLNLWKSGMHEYSPPLSCLASSWSLLVASCFFSPTINTCAAPLSLFMEPGQFSTYVVQTSLQLHSQYKSKGGEWSIKMETFKSESEITMVVVGLGTSPQLSRGVWGHAPPENFGILDVRRVFLRPSKGSFEVNFWQCHFSCTASNYNRWLRQVHVS